MLSYLAHAFVGTIMVAGEDSIVNNHSACCAGLQGWRYCCQSVARDSAAQLQKYKALVIVNNLKLC